MDRLQKILEKYHMEKWFRKENLIVLVLAGILLIVIALPTKDPDAKGTEAGSYQLSQEEPQPGLERENSLYKEAQVTGQDKMLAEEGSKFSDLMGAADYAAELENKLAAILSSIQGIEDVHVMITMQESEELVVEKDLLEKQEVSEKQELLESQETTIYETEGNATKPYVVKTIFPKAEGVAVVAKSKGNAKIVQNITELVQVLFDIEIHKIKVYIQQ